MAASNNCFPFPPGHVFYVPPLRIVAPPGVPPYLPAPFDPYNFFSGLRPEFSGPRPETNGGGFVHTAAGYGTPYVAGHETVDPTAAPSARNTTGSVNQNPNFGSKRYEAESSRSRSFAPEFSAGPSGNGTNSPKNVGKKPKINSDNGQRISGTGMSPGNSSGSARNLNNKQNSACAANASPGKKKSTVTDIPGNATSENLDRKRSKEPRPGKAASGSKNASSPHKAVVNTLRLYDALRRNLMLEEENRGKCTSKGSRPDLHAGSIVNSKCLAVNRSSKVVGSVPGVDVGDMFFFRMEMCCIGMHGPIQGGIEYLTVKESQYTMPVATSVISSGGYDAKDDGEELIYAGQGGKSKEDSKAVDDQKLERGNLALEGSRKHNVPVRVTRGIKDSASPSGKTYTYDGLYKVEESWSVKAKHGFEEFRFRLRRIPGQPELGSSLLKLSHSLKYNPNKREGLRVADISDGKEAMPVCVVNSVDDIQAPARFEYTTSLEYPNGSKYQQSGQTEGCDCLGGCDITQSCSCYKKNGSACAYLQYGALAKERSVVHECGSNCKCLPTCRNRLTQRALKYRLEVFRTEDEGWGLRSWDPIPAGSFICEYSGRLVPSLQTLQCRDYFLDFSRLPRKHPPWGDVSQYLDITELRSNVTAGRPNLVIDSSQCGNASRFINHSCSPNVLVQCVFRDNQPHAMLFAMDNIPPFRELTIDYGAN